MENSHESSIGTAAMRLSILIFVLFASGACHHPARATLVDNTGPLTAKDLADVFTPPASKGWFDYRSEGTPRGDTTARIASVGLWAMEGGDWERGIRLARAAYMRGLPDSNFYHDYIAVMRLARRPSDMRAACKTLAKLWPARSADRSICKTK